MDNEETSDVQGEGGPDQQQDVGLLQNEPSHASFLLSKPPKRSKGKEEGNNTFMTEALSVMKAASDKLNVPNFENDENRCFGNFIVSKMNNYSSQTKKGVQHAIF